MSKRPPPKPRRAPTEAQQRLGFELPAGTRRDRPKPLGEFVEGDDNQTFGQEPLAEYLERAGFSWVVKLARQVRELDYRTMEARYDARGRRALHPRLIIGLVAYGLIRGLRSLRDLETLARLDAGAFLMTGGVQPDHSTIGRVLVMHAEDLSAGFFVDATRMLAARMAAKAGTIAIDATIVDSVASHWNSLTVEAAAVVAAETKAASEKAQAALASVAPQEIPTASDDATAAATVAADVRELAREARKTKAAAENAARCAEIVSRRQERRENRGHKGNARVATSDPEAVFQPRKDGLLRPSFKPAIAVHESGLIVGQHVEPAYETASVVPLVNQHDQVFGAPPTTALLDAGYHNPLVLQLFCDKGVDVLCPAGSDFGSPEEGARISKDQFVYLHHQDVYRCPQGELLVLRETYRQGGGLTRRYRCNECEGCPLKARCTGGSAGRQISRYDGDELKEAMREVFKHPEARAKFRRRQAIVEPVFARLKVNNSLTRFSRRGRVGASLEFALNCLAYNLQLVVRRPASPGSSPDGTPPPGGRRKARRRPLADFRFTKTWRRRFMGLLGASYRVAWVDG